MSLWHSPTPGQNNLVTLFLVFGCQAAGRGSKSPTCKHNVTSSFYHGLHGNTTFDVEDLRSVPNDPSCLQLANSELEEGARTSQANHKAIGMEDATRPTGDGDEDIADAVGRLSVNSSQPTDIPTRDSPAVEKDAKPAPAFPSTQRPLSKPPPGTATSIKTPKEDPDRPGNSASLLRKASTTSLRDRATPPQSPHARRIISSPSSTKLTKPTTPDLNATPPLTAASVAREYLEEDLSNNQNTSLAHGCLETTVILQDDCYGHRYSRPRTSKAGLSTIVERPERIHAALMGVSTAYVRLGGRHVDGSAAPVPLRGPHTFHQHPLSVLRVPRRVSLTAPAVTAVHGMDWMNELATMCDGAEAKLAAGGKELTRPETQGNSGNPAPFAKPAFHEGDLYLCSQSRDALEGAIGGVCEAVDRVFGDNTCKRCFVCIRPPGHHCSADMPSGFCWLNNVHIGIAHAAIDHGLTHAAIIDFDLHHGDGSQAITWSHNAKVNFLPKNAPITKKRPIGYFSLHDINSYPCEMGDEDKVRNASLCIENAHGQSIWNVHLQPWKSESHFWELYETKYATLLEKVRSFLKSHSDRLRQHPTRPQPKAAIFLSAGFDASEWESPHMQRHQVNVPTAFYERITRDIISLANEAELGVDGRVVSVLEGGYSDRALTSGVLSHVCGLVNAETAESEQKPSAATVDGVNPDFANYTISGAPVKASIVPRSVKTDASWWSLPNLELLEETLSPKTTIEAPKKRRSDVKPTYTTVTESYKAKIVAPGPSRRSSSGSMFNQLSNNAEPRIPSPPPPEVDWATAAVELGRLLVPNDRETGSHRPEELNAEASRVRREKLLGKPPGVESKSADPARMNLREKRPKASPVEAKQDFRPQSKAGRRKTIADVKTLSEEMLEKPPLGDASDGQRPGRVTRRRSSAASSIISAFSEVDTQPLKTNPFAAANEADRVTKSATSAKARSEPVKSRIAKRPPVSRKISGSTVSTGMPEENQVSQISSIPEKSPEEQNLPEEQGVDQIASGMKKMSIKLNVPSREEHDAREKARVTSTKPKPQPAAPTSKAVKKPTTAKSRAKVTSPAKQRGKATPSNQVAAANSDDAHLPLPHEATAAGSDAAPLQASSKAEEKSQASVTGSTDSSAQLPDPPPIPSEVVMNDAFDPGSSATSDIPQAGQTTFTPKHPTVDAIIPQALPATPSTVRRLKQDLPVFTATSPINFAPRAPPPSNAVNPSEQKPIGALNSRTANEDLQLTRSLEGVGSAKTSAEATSLAEGGTIWDVPETPQAKKQSL